MRLLQTILALLCTLQFGQCFAAPVQPKAWGYIGWWLPQSWRSAPLAKFDRLLFFDLKVNADGNIVERRGWPEEWVEFRAAARLSGTPIDVTLTLFDSDAFNGLFASYDSTQRLVNHAIALASQPDVAGLHLDFEIYGVAHSQSIENFRTFVRLLSNRLQQISPRKNLSAFLTVGGESSLFDPSSLSLFDQIVIQGYDVHWPGSTSAGPVAPLSGEDAWTWEKMSMRAITLGIPREKQFLGFPLFGYEWPVKGLSPRSATQGKGVVTSYAPLAADSTGDIQFSVQERVREFGAVHDSRSGSSHYHFKRSDGQHMEGWFEDWWALDRKIDFLIDKKLGGIAFFLIGYDGGQLVDFFMHQRSRVPSGTPRLLAPNPGDAPK